jgi:hypothetical protein
MALCEKIVYYSVIDQIAWRLAGRAGRRNSRPAPAHLRAHTYTHTLTPCELLASEGSAVEGLELALELERVVVEVLHDLGEL